MEESENRDRADLLLLLLQYTHIVFDLVFHPLPRTTMLLLYGVLSLFFRVPSFFVLFAFSRSPLPFVALHSALSLCLRLNYPSPLYLCLLQPPHPLGLLHFFSRILNYSVHLLSHRWKIPDFLYQSIFWLIFKRYRIPALDLCYFATELK